MLAKIRKAIDRRAADWRRAKGGRAFRSRYELGGDSLKRPPKGYDAAHPWIEDLKRKDHIAVAKLDHDALFSSAIVNETAATFRAAKAYVKFLCDATGVKF